MSKKKTSRGKIQRFGASDRSKMISLQDFPRFVTVVREKNSPAPGAIENIGFSGYLPLPNRENIKKLLTSSVSTEPIEMAKYSVFTDGIRQAPSQTSLFAYSLPAFLFSFSLAFSSFHFCRHLQ